MAVRQSESSVATGTSTASASADDNRLFASDISFELETSVPTDLTISPVSDDDKRQVHAKYKDPVFSRYMAERKQLINDLYRLKMQLPQKTMLLQQLKSELVSRTEELEEKYRGAVLEKKVLQMKLEAQLKFTEDEAKQKQLQCNKDMETILSKQRQLEETNRRLQDAACNLKQSVDDINFSELEYSDLVNRKASELSLKDYITLKIYQFVWPLKELKTKLGNDVVSLKNDLQKCQQDLLLAKEISEKEKEEHFQLRNKFDIVNLQLNDAKSRIKYGNFAQENFSRVKEERDKFEGVNLELKENLQHKQITLNLITQERDDLKNEKTVLKQQGTLLQQECDRYAKQVGSLTQKLGDAQDQVARLTLQLNNAKHSQDEMLNRLLTVRNQCKTEYENKLHEERERLHNSAGAFYNREIVSLKESRDISLKQKEEISSVAEENRKKYEDLLNEVRQSKLEENALISTLEKELQEKTAEVRRKQGTQAEMASSLQEKELENEKLKTKVEMLSNELHIVRGDTQQRQIQLDRELADHKARLEVYEKLEQELDEVVNQAAQVTDELNAERMIKTYTQQMVMPTSSKMRLLQSVSLTRRILQQEREIQHLKDELDNEKEKCENFSQQLSEAQQILDQTHQPYSYLIAILKEKDLKLQEQHSKVAHLQKDLVTVRKENADLSIEHNSLAADIEKLLSNREEMVKLKQLLSNMYISQHNRPRALAIKDNSSEQHITEMAKEFPEWYKKLKKK